MSVETRAMTDLEVRLSREVMEFRADAAVIGLHLSLANIALAAQRSEIAELLAMADAAAFNSSPYRRDNP